MKLNYIFSKDHRIIGIQYALTSAFFLFVGFLLIALMRWQLAFPGKPLSWLGPILGDSRMPSGILLPEFYNQLGAMHGTIMIFLGVVPLAVGAFGNYLIPLQIGAKDMAFPRLNMLSYWTYLFSGILMMIAFIVPGGAAQAGWTSYPPLANTMPIGQSLWLVGIFVLGISSVVGSINFIVTIIHMRKKGLGFFDLPFFIWAQLITAVLLLLAFPPLQIAGLLQLMDRVFFSSFFLPSGLVVSGEVLEVAGGGSPLLYQHLFWFLAHPEVYVLILPAMGIVASVIRCHTQKALYGYKSMVYATCFLGVMSFIVWAHHMFLTGMGPTMSAFFQVTTMIISIPSVILLTCLVLSLWGGRIRYTTAMLFALAFLPMFGLGGLTGIPLGLAAADIHLHDTYYVIGHFHYIVAPGTLFALFAGIYYWFPKVSGKQLNEFWGKVHFWLSLVFINGVFFPMFLMGLAGVSRRLWDPTQYAHAVPTQGLNVFSSFSAWGLGIVQVIFILNFVMTLRGKKTSNLNPWQSEGLEWHPEVQEQSQEALIHPMTLWSNARFGSILFIASEIMFFGALLSATIFLWKASSGWTGALHALPLWPAVLNTLLLTGLTACLYAARNALPSNIKSTQRLLLFSILLGAVFILSKSYAYGIHFTNGIKPNLHNYYALYYVFTSLHILHVFGGLCVNYWLMKQKTADWDKSIQLYSERMKSLLYYWVFVEIIWVMIVVIFYV